MSMFENRMAWLVGITMLIVFLQLAEFGFEHTYSQGIIDPDIEDYTIEVPEGSVGYPDEIAENKSGTHEERVDIGTAIRNWVLDNIIGPATDFFLIGEDLGVPSFLMIILSAINGLLILLLAMIWITWALDAAPFVGS